jgi:hypothetical protein
MMDFNKALPVVLDHYGVEEAELFSRSQKSELIMPRKMLIYLMRHLTNKAISKLIHRSEEVVRLYRTQMNYAVERNESIRTNYELILSKIQNLMNLKLTNAQLGSLHDIFEHFLSMKPDSVTLELIFLLIEEIKEKCRKKSRSGKENLSLDEKQLRAFLIWYHHFGGMYKENHPYAHMTLLDMIGQIKPIANAQRIAITT